MQIMILSVGEILADIVGSGHLYEMYCGGAPFNVAVGAKRAGAVVGFVGKVGNDPVGRFLDVESAKACLDDLRLVVDPVRNTTLAFVSLKDGERDFSFFRHDTADYQLGEEDVCLTPAPAILHLGTLMLSTACGRRFADGLIARAHQAGILLSMDVNLRMDLFASPEEAIRVYTPYLKEASILKLSEDEAMLLSGKDEIVDAMRALYTPGQLMVVTMGSRGSMCQLNDAVYTVPSIPLKPIDTTGAGDAFWGTFLAHIEGKEWTADTLTNAMKQANAAGANATQFKGAIQL